MSRSRRTLKLALLALVVLSIALLAVACGGSKEATDTTTQTQTQTNESDGTTINTRRVLVYFMRDGQIAAVARRLPRVLAVGRAALNRMIPGPTAKEQSIGLGSTIAGGTRVLSLEIENGQATLSLSSALYRSALAQVVFTLTQFATVKKVVVIAGGTTTEPLDRSSFENLSPAILVETPSPYEPVSSPLRVTGTANVFEATFQLELRDSSDTVIAQKTVTATSGTGTRGTFDTTLKFSGGSGPATLIAFEYSAEDGSRIHQVEIPIRISG